MEALQLFVSELDEEILSGGLLNEDNPGKAAMNMASATGMRAGIALVLNIRHQDEGEEDFEPDGEGY